MLDALLARARRLLPGWGPRHYQAAGGQFRQGGMNVNDELQNCISELETAKAKLAATREAGIVRALELRLAILQVEEGKAINAALRASLKEERT